jgi:hypothetical protein
MTFGTRHKRKKKKYARESKLPVWSDMMVWKDFKPP